MTEMRHCVAAVSLWNSNGYSHRTIILVLPAELCIAFATTTDFHKTIDESVRFIVAYS